jgi:acyl-CoA thioesterase
MPHPFAEHIALAVVQQQAGASRCEIEIASHHLNPHGVVHGAVLFALADTGMGAALYPTLQPGESCATIELKISFLRPAAAGTLVCETTLLRRGRAVAHLESKLTLAGELVATASGSYAVYARRGAGE